MIATLRDADLDEFLAFATRMGYESLPTRRDFEVLRLKKGHAPTVVFCRRNRDPNVIWPERGEAMKLVNYWQAYKKTTRTQDPTRYAEHIKNGAGWKDPSKGYGGGL